MKNKKPKNSPEFEKLKTDHAATLLELERMRSMLREEQERSRKDAREILEAVRQKHKLEVIGLIAEGKKEEAIQSVLRPDVVLFSMEVRFANDETLEMARKEWYEKGKADLMAEIRKCTLVARQEI